MAGSGLPGPAQRAVSPAERAVVNAAGLVQGIVLVTFPAASTIFTQRPGYGLSAGQYGLMFVPQVITAVAAALLGAGLLGPALAARHGEKPICVAGLLADLVSMLALIASWLVVHEHALAYGLLLAATAFLGAGFGLTVPALNTLAAAFSPGSAGRAVLVLNALLGLGTALAPVFAAVFVGLGFWIGLPVLAAVLLLAVIGTIARLPLQPAPAPAPAGAAADGSGRVPAAFWLLGLLGLLYGVGETMNGNWSQLDMTAALHVRASSAALALTAFWAVVTAGRIGFAAAARWLPGRVTYHVLPFVLAGTFVLIAVLPSGRPALAVAAFGLAGLGCSALLPLTISFGQEKLASRQDMVAGGVIACYQVGYGIAAFGVGPLTSAGISLPEIFGASAAVAVVMGVVSLAAVRGRPSPQAVHPRPAPPSPRSQRVPAASPAGLPPVG